MNKILLDAREMEHPLPLKLSIEYLKEMRESDYLYMINNKKPIPLLEMLKERGFVHFEHQDESETWHIIISKNSTVNLSGLLDV